MVLCHICIEQVKDPVSLPCGHIFCTNCIIKAIRAVKHFTNFHPCPDCRSIYNIAPVNLRMVPPNLRLFVTPSIRRLYIDSHLPEEEKNDTPIVSTSSEISRLQAENHALRNHYVTWRRRAEMHGSTNLKLIKLAHTIRDQASHIAHERDELERHCSWLKRKLEDDESWTRRNATSCTSHECSVKAEASSPPPRSFTPSFSTSPTSALPPTPHPSRHASYEAISLRKRSRINSKLPIVADKQTPI